MCLIIALAMGNSGETVFAHWQFTYPYSGNPEDDRVYTQDQTLYYARTAVDRATDALTGPTLTDRMRTDNIRDVTINETTTELHVQIWGILNTSVLVLHFTKEQHALAQRVARDLERLEFGGYFPMQNRAKIPPSSSSVTASPVS